MLHSACPPALWCPHIAVIEQWHARVHYHVSESGGHTAVIPTAQGMCQGCPIAPTLWAAYTLLIMDAVRVEFDDQWLQEHLTLFADDAHCGWLFHDERELSLAEAAQLLSLLVSMGLRINASKSVALVTLGGTRASHVRKQLIPSADKPFITFVDGQSTWSLPVVRKHVYLGACVGYHSFGLRQAAANFTRLRKVLMSKRYLSLHWRIRLWRSTVLSSLEYGIAGAGLTKRGLHRFRACVMKQLRSIASSPVYITRETNQALLQRMDTGDPFLSLIEHAAKAFQLITDQLHHLPCFFLTIQDSAATVFGWPTCTLLRRYADPGYSTRHSSSNMRGVLF